MPSRHATQATSSSIAKQLSAVLSRAVVDEVARDTEFMIRRRAIDPFKLVLACLSTLGEGDTTAIADIHRGFNRLAGNPVEYKPFHAKLG